MTGRFPNAVEPLHVRHSITSRELDTATADAGAGPMWLALAVSVVGAVVTIGGIFAVRLREDWVQAHRAMLTAFAAGVLLTVSFLHLIPEAFEENTAAAGTGLLGGFLFLYLVTRLALAAAAASISGERALGVAALVGIGFHSFVDGILFSIGFSIDERTGLIIAPGMILHEFIEGALIYKLLLFGGFQRGRALLLAITAGALTTPLGVVVSWPLVVELRSTMAALLMAGAAGSLIYVGGSHLLPQSEEERRHHPAALVAGVALAIVIVLLKNH